MVAGMKRIFLTKLTDINTTDKENVGTLRREGNEEYIYLKGVASVANGSWVTYDKSYATTLLATGSAAGPLPVALGIAAVVASSFGWFQIRGIHAAAKVLASCAASAALYNSGTAGAVDDASASLVRVYNAVLTGSESSSVAGAHVMYPWVG